MKRIGWTRKFIKRNYFPLLISFYFFYLLFLIFRTTFFIDGQIYFSLFDDEMVSMRYAKNLVEGNGLIWNMAERIEGFSNPLWTLYMAFWHLFRIPSYLISLPIQLTNVLFLIVNLFFVKKIAELVSDKNNFVVFISLLLTMFYFPLNNWAILGTETTPLILITSIAVFLFLKNQKEKKFTTLPFIILGVGTLIRIDFAAIYLAFLIFMFFTDENKKNIIPAFFILIISLAIQFIPRLIYYSELLPNTYFLKMTGFPVIYRITRGIYSLIGFLVSGGFVFMIPLIFAFKINRVMRIFLPVILIPIIYSIYVGGDVWEYFGGANRYIAIIMPLFFILFAQSLYKLKVIFAKNNLKKSVIYLLIIVSIFVMNSSGTDMLRDALGLSYNQTVGANKMNLEKALIINKIAKPNSTVAVEWAGVMPYFSNKNYHIDLLGKNDKYIARLNSDKFLDISEKNVLINFKPGHTKWDYKYSIINKKPDIIAQLPNDYDVYVFVQKNYKLIKRGHLEMYFLADSKNVDISKIE